MIQPTSDRVLIKVEKAKEATVSGIILTSKSEKGSLRGEVVAEGGHPDRASIVGKTVYYPRYAFVEVEDEGEVYHIIKFEDVICYI